MILSISNFMSIVWLNYLWKLYKTRDVFQKFLMFNLNLRESKHFQERTIYTWHVLSLTFYKYIKGKKTKIVDLKVNIKINMSICSY